MSKDAPKATMPKSAIKQLGQAVLVIVLSTLMIATARAINSNGKAIAVERSQTAAVSKRLDEIRSDIRSLMQQVATDRRAIDARLDLIIGKLP